MPDQIYSWEQLNAYVDGELPAAAAADIASAAADDPRVAQAIATLAHLKSATRGDLDSKAEEAPTIHAQPARRAAPGFCGKRPLALAAGLVLAAIVGGAAGYGLYHSQSSRSWISAAEDQHEEWLASAVKVGQENSPGLHRTTGSAATFMEVSVNGVTGHAPDLSLMDMRITRLSNLRSETGEQFFIGYLGENGCQLSLTIAAAPKGLESALSMEWQGDRQATAHWRVRETAYAAVAHKMDRQRFKQLTAYLEQVTRQAGEKEEATQMARDMDEEGEPCMA